MLAPRVTVLPSLEVSFTEPTEALQLVLMMLLAVSITAAGSVSVKLPVFSHPFTSVTTTVYVPAVNDEGSCPLKPLLHA